MLQKEESLSFGGDIFVFYKVFVTFHHWQ